MTLINDKGKDDDDDSLVFPDLPIICLSTAKDLTTHELLKGKNVVIDFWTTRCTRCPKALDRLDCIAAEEKKKKNDVVSSGSSDKDKDVTLFVSICCDKLDGAREIIDKDDERKWPNIQHYYMVPESKEIAKNVLGFASVPFYVMINAHGTITQKGNKVDWTQLPSSSSTSPTASSSVCSKTLTVDTPSLDQENQPVQTAATSQEKVEKQASSPLVVKEPVVASDEARAFVLDDLDF